MPLSTHMHRLPLCVYVCCRGVSVSRSCLPTRAQQQKVKLSGNNNIIRKRCFLRYSVRQRKNVAGRLGTGCGRFLPARLINNTTFLRRVPETLIVERCRLSPSVVCESSSVGNSSTNEPTALKVLT